ncbi:PHD finger protein ALFIN-LIKE 4 [Tanacetum coccineum]
MEGGRTVEEVFRNFKGRRTGIIKALTTDVADFFQQCDPEKENLCLYGFPSEQWEVTLPAEEVPPELPEPALGINFARDGMQRKDWLALVAVHSDVWLLSVAFYFGTRFGFDKAQRSKRLFNMINDLPTIFEVISAPAIKHPSNNSSNKSKSNKQRGSEPQAVKYGKVEEEEEVEEVEEEEEEEEDDEHGDTSCGFCGDNYASDRFWICCDLCERWFHGKCVRITPAKAKTITHYKCPICNGHKRPRP